MGGDGLMVLKARLTEVEALINDVNRRWPAHSVSPKIMMQLEDLEDEREEILKKIKEFPSPTENDLLDEITQKVQSVLEMVRLLREMVEGDAESEGLIEETTKIRTHLDEVEELIIKKFSKECLTSVAKEDGSSDVKDLLDIIYKFIR